MGDGEMTELGPAQTVMPTELSQLGELPSQIILQAGPGQNKEQLLEETQRILQQLTNQQAAGTGSSGQTLCHILCIVLTLA